MSKSHKLIHSLFSRSAMPHWCVLIMDMLFVLFSYYFGMYFEFGLVVLAESFLPVTRGAILVLLVFVCFFKVLHTYCGIVRYSNITDIKHILVANLSSIACVGLMSFLVSRFFGGFIAVPGFRACMALFLLTTLFMLLSRIVVKDMYTTFVQEKNTQHVFIYGVQNGAVAVANAVKVPTSFMRSKVVGFISPNGDRVSSYLDGIPVYDANDSDLVKIMLNSKVVSVFVSPLQTSVFRRQETLIENIIKAGIKIYMMPDPEAWDGNSVIRDTQFREVDIEYLLQRPEIRIDLDAIAVQLRGKTVLITGAAGSIGSEIVRQVASFNPFKMVLIDQAETPMHDLRLMLADKYAYIKSHTVVASITNGACMEKLFADNKPDYVFHAAAYKHVPMMENNPCIAVQNNVFGTRVIADLAVKYGVTKFVMVSTDKAVNPTNVMGCSKRICEIYCQSLNKAIQEGVVKGRTQFVTTRFGNVLGSNGSVIPLFRKQISEGLPVTVTHPDITRFFMLIKEACELVLEAGVMGHGGEIYVFDMGKPVKIKDLAQKMIDISGKELPIKYTGLRDGEKLYEEVLANAENTKPTSNPQIMIADVREYDYEEACRNEERLLEASRFFDSFEVVRIMKEIVPEYKSQHSVYEKLDKN